MDKIIIEKRPPEKKARRSSVVVKPETYSKIYELHVITNTPVETLVDMLLNEALKAVEIVDTK